MIDGKECVVFFNPHREQGIGPEGVGEIKSEKGEIHARYEYLPTDEFMGRLCDVHLLEHEGNTQLTSDVQVIQDSLAGQISMTLRRKEEEKKPTSPLMITEAPIEFREVEVNNVIDLESVLDQENKASSTEGKDNWYHRDHEIKMQNQLAQEEAKKAGEVTLKNAPKEASNVIDATNKFGSISKLNNPFLNGGGAAGE